VGWVEQQTPQNQASQFYIGYLKDAAAIFESAIMRLKHCDFSQCDVADATDMAHRIKGNAAMYNYPDLGLKAAKVEALLRAQPDGVDHASALLSLINLVDNIQDICQDVGKSEPKRLHMTLAAEDKDIIPVSQSAAVSFGRKSILIAYQDSWICELMTSLLTPEFDVMSVRTGEEVKRMVRDYKPDLVILEDTLEDVSGLDLLRHFKAHTASHTPAIFIAFSSNSQDLIAKAIGLGVDGFTEDKHEILEITTFAKNLFLQTQKSVLVVDDDPVVRELLSHILSGDGLKVDTASDGIEALAYLSSNTPDIVLLDRFMPRLEGGTVLYEIQNKINLKSIPVLILTAMVNRGEAKSWFERGAADFIPKPFDPEEVLMRVRQHLDAKQKVA